MYIYIHTHETGTCVSFEDIMYWPNKTFRHGSGAAVYVFIGLKFSRSLFFFRISNAGGNGYPFFIIRPTDRAVSSAYLNHRCAETKMCLSVFSTVSVL